MRVAHYAPPPDVGKDLNSLLDKICDDIQEQTEEISRYDSALASIKIVEQMLEIQRDALESMMNDENPLHEVKKETIN